MTEYLIFFFYVLHNNQKEKVKLIAEEEEDLDEFTRSHKEKRKLKFYNNLTKIIINSLIHLKSSKTHKDQITLDITLNTLSEIKHSSYFV